MAPKKGTMPWNKGVPWSASTKKTISESRKRTHCAKGHEFTSDNEYSYTDKEGHFVRQCKICVTAKNTRRAMQLRASHLMRKFGITLEQYDAMLVEQGGRCAACGTDEPGGMGSFHVDHCHATGKVRKLLCVRCNSCL